MNKFRILIILFTLIVMNVGCKKEDVTTQVSGDLKVDSAGRIIFGSDLDGAFYSYIVKIIYPNPDDNDISNISYAWFGDSNKCLDAGEVTVNEVPLFKPTISGEWYTDFNADIFGSGSSIDWVVEGSNAVKGFNFTDKSSMPLDADYSLPATIDIRNSFTLKHNDTKAKGIIYGVIGNNGQFEKLVLGNSTSYTFTSNELAKAAFEQDLIGFKVAAIYSEEQTIQGKKYIFVKVKQIQKETETK